MDDYISREAVIKEFCDDCMDREWCKSNGTYCSRIHNINTVPPADAAEVVRCKDCIHRPIVKDVSKPYGFGITGPDENGDTDFTCPYLCDDEYYNRMPKDDWYCSSGERRAE